MNKTNVAASAIHAVSLGQGVISVMYEYMCRQACVFVCFDIIPRWIIFCLKSQLYTPGFHQHDYAHAVKGK